MREHSSSNTDALIPKVRTHVSVSSMVKHNPEQLKIARAPPAGSDGMRTRARIDPLIAVVAGGILIVCAILFVMMVSGSQPVVPAATCGERTLSYVNKNLVSAGMEATLVSINETRGIYLVTVAYQGRRIPLYTTRDCTLLFLEGRDMVASTGTLAGVTPAPSATPVKTGRPAVELYVMSFCPYGKQAETAMKPVSDLLGSRADIRVMYITNVGGTVVDSVESLHGAVEAQEDLRQVCIQKYSPDRFWSYVSGFNTACFSLLGNPQAAAACSKNVTSSLGISQAGIDTCATGAEGITLLKSHEASAMREGATASPTLLINGVRYSGARTPEAYKQAICGSFTISPPECQTVLSTQQVSAGGSC